MTATVVRARRYQKILEVGPLPPPHAGWGVRIQYVLQGMQEAGLTTAALDIGPSRMQDRPGVDCAKSAWEYAWKVPVYLFRGYRIHHHLNGDSTKAYALVLYGLIWSFLFGRRAVLTWHGGIPQRWFPRQHRFWIDNLHRLIFALSHRIICNERYIQAYLEDYGVSATKIVPIQAFSRQYLEFNRVPLPADWESFLARSTPRLFSYLLNRPEYHGDVLLTALENVRAIHPQFGIFLVGRRESDESFAAQVEARGLSRHVVFTGDLPRDQFLSLLERSDLYVRTPHRDGVSSSVLESLSLGVPVVAAANPLRPPQVKTYPAEDADALTKTLLETLAIECQQERTPLLDVPDTVEREIDVLTD